MEIGPLICRQPGFSHEAGVEKMSLASDLGLKFVFIRVNSRPNLVVNQPHHPSGHPHSDHEHAKAIRAVAQHFSGVIAEADPEYHGREEGKEESG
jgi:hypothetical protein